MKKLYNIDFLNEILGDSEPEYALQWLSDHEQFQPVFSTSFGQEDQAITDQIFRHNLDIDLFTLDTGRLFQETYDVLDQTRRKYNRTIDVYYPNHDSVEALMTEKGPNSFYESVENRKECCGIRKVEPLKRALKHYNIWITGLRAGQSSNRKSFRRFQYDPTFDIIKFNPLLYWSLEQVKEYLAEHQVPQNKLHKQGFVSIGCAPCTRAIKPSEDIRAGRWWWETSKKECGLHTSIESSKVKAERNWQ